MARWDASPRALAVAVVDRALELYGAREPDRRLDEALLADHGVQAILGAGSIPFDSEALTRLAIVLARDVIGVWSGVYPESKAPLAAL